MSGADDLRAMKYRQLAIANPDDLLFGTAPKPLRTRQGLHLGGGMVYPELNFTLPTMEVTAATMPQVFRHYREIITGALRRAAELEAPGVVIEFETVPPMTATPAFGLEIVEYNPFLDRNGATRELVLRLAAAALVPGVAPSLVPLAPRLAA